MSQSTVFKPLATMNAHVSLSLFKLSHCTTPNLQSNLLWTHLPNRDNMYAVFDRIRKTSLEGLIVEQKVMKLICYGELLEQIDLEELRFQAHRDEERRRSQAVNDRDRFVLMIIQKPLVALRYQLPDGQIRRIQMNFLPDSGYDTAVNTLRSFDLPVLDRNKLPESQVPFLQRKPLSQSGFPSSSQTQPQEHCSAYISQREFNPPSAQPPPHQSGSQPNSTRDAAIDDGFSRPTVPFWYQYIPQRSHDVALDAQNSVLKDASYRRPSSSSDIFGLRADQIMPSSLQPGPELHPRGSLDNSFERRPTSAPEIQQGFLWHDPVTPSQMMPPRRELPFPKEKEKPPITEKKSDSAKVSRKPPSAKQASVKVVKPRKSRAKAGKARSPIPEQTMPTPAPSSSAPPAPARKRAKKSPSLVAALKDAATIDESREAPATTSEPLMPPSSPPVATASPKRKNTSSALTSANVRDSSAQVSRKQHTPINPILSVVQPEEFMASLDTWIRRYHDLPAPKPPQTAKEQLADFAGQSEEERAKAIEQLLCECLEDENFGTLVEDVEVTWRKIGFGLQ